MNFIIQSYKVDGLIVDVYRNSIEDIVIGLAEDKGKGEDYEYLITLGDGDTNDILGNPTIFNKFLDSLKANSSYYGNAYAKIDDAYKPSPLVGLGFAIATSSIDNPLNLDAGVYVIFDEGASKYISKLGGNDE